MRSCLMVSLVVWAVSAGFVWAERPYTADWNSLKKHRDPEWFDDAKFGIYTHWGPVTVGAEDGPRGVQWYGRNMYVKKSPTFKYHKEKYGDQSKVGYKDMIPKFKAEKFNAEEWAELFAASGAKFAGPVVIHHDNYALWDSKYTIWDSMDQAPKRDFTAELEKAIKKRGMRFIATFHHAFAWQYFEPALDYDAADGKYAGLYGEPRKKGAPPSKAYLDKWLGMINEVVEKYEPELIWFDFGLRKVITEPYRLRMFADYYNWGAAKKLGVCVAHKHWDIHEHTGIIDFERGRMDKVTEFPWLTDTALGPWFHQKSTPFKTTDQLVDVLVDIVSKNGNMLLNVGPQADGLIPEEGKKLLLGIGEWLKVNGEAIFATRPWIIHGEGPTQQEKSGGFSEHKDKNYTSEDIRFTRSKDGKTVYVIALGWPAENVEVNTMKLTGEGRVSLVGHEGAVEHSLNEEGRLTIRVPGLERGERPCEHAFAFKLTGFEVDMHPDARFSLPGAVTVPVGKVTLEGEKVRVQDVGGRPNIGAWDNPGEKAHWLVWLKSAGTYMVRGEFSSAYAPSGFKTTFAGQTHGSDVPRTQGWFKPVFVNLGRFKVEEPGVHRLTLEPKDPATWSAVNVWELQLARVD